MAGYSGTPLARKLGVKPEQRVLVERAPAEFELGPDQPAPLTIHRRDGGGDPYDLVLCFVTDRAMLARRLPRLLERIPSDGTIWVCWPKRASKVPTDMTEDVVREIGLPLGLVDVKVAAIDETWSGLKMVIRRELR